LHVVYTYLRENRFVSINIISDKLIYEKAASPHGPAKGYLIQSSEMQAYATETKLPEQSQLK